MPPIPLTFLGLLIIAAALLLLRSHWPTLQRSTRRLILALAFVPIALLLFGYGTHWVTISDRFNCAIYWGAVTGYLLLLTLHSLNRPRWLTSLSALILALPILSSALFLPLTGIFEPDHRRVHPLGHQLYASWLPFVEGTSTGSGADVDISYRPRLLPFMRHSRLGGRFYDTFCNSAATEVQLQPDHESVFVRCPPWPGSGEVDPGYILRLH
jgi:hypothetical protein